MVQGRQNTGKIGWDIEGREGVKWELGLALL